MKSFGMQNLKPSKFAVNQHCVIKLLDFGLDRSVIKSSFHTKRYYEAPEIILDQNLSQKGESQYLQIIYQLPFIDKSSE